MYLIFWDIKNSFFFLFQLYSKPYTASMINSIVFESNFMKDFLKDHLKKDPLWNY